MGGWVSYASHLDENGNGILPQSESFMMRFLIPYLDRDLLDDVVWVDLNNTQVRDLSALASLKKLKTLQLDRRQ